MNRLLLSFGSFGPLNLATVYFHPFGPSTLDLAQRELPKMYQRARYDLDPTFPQRQQADYPRGHSFETVSIQPYFMVTKINF